MFLKVTSSGGVIGRFCWANSQQDNPAWQGAPRQGRRGSCWLYPASFDWAGNYRILRTLVEGSRP